MLNLASNDAILLYKVYFYPFFFAYSNKYYIQNLILFTE